MRLLLRGHLKCRLLGLLGLGLNRLHLILECLLHLRWHGLLYDWLMHLGLMHLGQMGLILRLDRLQMGLQMCGQMCGRLVLPALLAL